MTVQLLKFSAAWCQPCTAMAKTLEQVLPEFPGTELVEVDVEVDREQAQRYNVRTLPTLAVGDHRLVGNVPAGRVREFLAKALK